jgi:hypothetical protein
MASSASPLITLTDPQQWLKQQSSGAPATLPDSPAPPLGDPQQWLTKNQNAAPQGSDALGRLWDAFKGAVNPIPAVQEWWNRGDSNKAVGDALAVGMKARGRQMTPDEQAIFDKGTQALGNRDPTNPAGGADIVPFGTQPALLAGNQAVHGNVAGAVGTVLGAYGVPAAIGAAGGGIDAAADSTSQGLMKSALKGGYAVTTPADEVAAAAKLARQEKITVTPAGQAKIGKALTDLRQQIDPKIAGAANAGVTVDPSAVIQRAMQVFNKYKAQPNPNSDLADIQTTIKNFAANNPGPIPIDWAQAMKVGGNTLNAEKYGKLSSAAVEGEKALTRGLKEEIGAQLPEIDSLNERQSAFMGLDDILSKAVNKYRNSDGFVGDLKTTDPASAALRTILANPVVKSRVATAIDFVRAANPGKFTTAGGGLQSVNNIIQGLTPQAPAQPQTPQQ